MITKQSQETLDFLDSIIAKTPSLGDYICAIRKSEETSQVNFAKQLGVSKQNLCDIEHGRRFISPKMAAEFATKLGYSVNQFIRLCFQDMLNRDGLKLCVDVADTA
jgi:transcriptional regulator with XRE-family HTH domain